MAELYSHTGRPSILPELMVKRRDKRSNEPHASTSDPDAWLFGKGNGQESRLAYLGHALMENRNGLIETRTTRHQGYAISLAVQKRIEEACGWAKPVGGFAKLKVRGLTRADAAFTFQMIAYNPIWIPKLVGQPA